LGATGITFDITGGTLNLDHNDNTGTYTLDSSLAGLNGAVNALSGITTLTADNSGFFGQTTLQGGSTLIVNQVLGGQVQVDSGAVLSGVGSIGMGLRNSTMPTAINNAGKIMAMNALPGHETDAISNLSVGTLTNSGTIQLAGGGAGSVASVGNTLTVTGGMTGGGHLVINTVLGDDNSPTDKLILDKGATSGTTLLTVMAQSGSTTAGTTQGIQVVETRNGAETTPDAFSLNSTSSNYRAGHGTVAMGAYDYALVRGGVGGVPDSWYLTVAGQPTTNPTPRPESGVYLGNQQIVQTMLRTTLHEREGSRERSAGQNPEEKRKSWVRVVDSHTHSQAASGRLTTKTHSDQIQLGTALLNRTNSNQSNVVAGVMAGYGKATSKTTSHSYSYAARGKTHGYQVGVYGTWYQNAQMTGLYVDSAVQYGWYKNEANGEGLGKDQYNARAWSASLESGYAMIFNESEQRQWVIEPQVQIGYTSYHADTHRDAGGTQIKLQDGKGIFTRIGSRLYTRSKEGAGRTVQPFVEVNWLHNNPVGSVALNSDVINSNGPKNIGELKLGVEGALTRHWSIGANVGLQKGASHYRNVNALVGAKCRWK